MLNSTTKFHKLLLKKSKNQKNTKNINTSLNSSNSEPVIFTGQHLYKV